MIVAIAATPNDPKALAEILRNLPQETIPSIVVAPYVDGAGSAPLEYEALPEMIEARAGERIEPARVYFVAYDRPVLIEAGRFVAAGAGAAPVTSLFASLAEDAGENSIAIVLSGASPPDIAGLEAIKTRGGVTLAQDPASALFDAAPRAAIARGLADFVLPPAEFARQLAIIARRPSSDGLPDSGGSEVADEVDEPEDIPPDDPLRKILALLRARFRVDLASYKLTTIRRRVERRRALSQFEDLSAYAEHLRANPDGLKILHDDLFIHVTQFFRDQESFDALRTRVFPKIFEGRSADDPIRIWVPGCSTGEEAYSIAIAIVEFTEARNAKARVQIFATDISDVAIQQARAAIYPELALRDLGPQRVERFFERTTDAYKVKKEIRDLCVISRHDITTNPPFAHLDLISCRNVLIYFGPVLQKRILPVFHFALKLGGFLWLGRSETPGTSSKLFSLIDQQHKIYAKVPAPRGYLQLAKSFTIEHLKPSKRDDKTAHNFQHAADQHVLLRYGPPAVVIDDNLEILQFRGRTAPFLGPPAGPPTHNLLKMAHPELLPVLRQLVQAAKKQNRPVRKEKLAIDGAGVPVTINVEVVPLAAAAADPDRQFLILFESAGARTDSAPIPPAMPVEAAVTVEERARDGNAAYVTQLLEEVDELREYQQTLIEQFESSQEELTSANEELQATNEEVQSSNEELEAAKEELQAANEELMTMNDELQNRNVELVALNEKMARGEDRFRLMVESVKDYAIYLLDPDGRVVSWNEGARRLKGYEAPEIIGQHYSRFFTPEEIALDIPKNELEHARIEGRYEAAGWRVRKDGTRFWANVIVSRVNDSKGTLVGYSKVTRDLTERKHAEEALEQSERRFRLMISGVRDYAIFMLDPEWRVASWNEGARQLKGYSETEIVGKHFSVFYPRDDVATGKIEREMAAVATYGRMEDEGWRVRKDGTRFWANVIITRILDTDGRTVGYAKVTRDLTERKRAENALRKANETLEQRVEERTNDLKRALETRDEFLSIASHELKTPLTGLKLQLQLASRAARSTKIVSPDSVERALRQAVALEELIDDLLDVSRIQTGRFELELEDIRAAALTEEVLARFSDQLAQANCTVSTTLDHSIVGRWDRKRIGQVLSNLLSNAIKYAPRSMVRISCARNGGDVELVVEDSGPGISKDRQGSIFERFERAGASPSVGGLGLGLFIARTIVEAHRGTISVESEPGHGSRFLVHLPLEPKTMYSSSDLVEGPAA